MHHSPSPPIPSYGTASKAAATPPTQPTQNSTSANAAAWAQYYAQLAQYQQQYPQYYHYYQQHQQYPQPSWTTAAPAPAPVPVPAPTNPTADWQKYTTQMERQAELQKQRLTQLAQSATSSPSRSYSNGSPVNSHNGQCSPQTTPATSCPAAPSYSSVAQRPRPTNTELAQAPSYMVVKKRPAAPENIPNATVTTSSAGKSGDTWPKSLTEYCARVLGSCQQSKRSGIEEKLRVLILDARNKNSLWSIDWEQMPVPGPNDNADSFNFVNLSTSSSSSLTTTQKPFFKKSTIPLQTIQFGKKAAKPSTSILDIRLGKGNVTSNTTLDPAQSSRRNERLKRFQCDEESELSEQMRKKREISLAQAAFVSAGAEGNPDVIDWDEFTIIGTCQKLEKPYLRLTSAPDPTTVRPLPILKQTLDLLKSKWKSEHNYTFICDQFKSLRQDLTVQRVKSEFTVKVYETHARIALEKGDLGEYNQCQAQLKQLYNIYKLPGSTDEFIAYRIIYMLHTMNKRDLFNTISELGEQDKKGECVQYALAVRSALTSSNYHMLFGLYHQAPKMCGYLMDHFMERERQKTLCSVLKSFRPSVGLEYLAVVLGFIPRQLTGCVESLGYQRVGISFVSCSVVDSTSIRNLHNVQPDASVDCLSTVSSVAEHSAVDASKFTTPIEHSSADRQIVSDAIQTTEAWLNGMNVVWASPIQQSLSATSSLKEKRKFTTNPSLKHERKQASNLASIPSHLKSIDCKASMSVVMERAKATFAKGVDIKGQIH
ncbi:hypothetical protein O5D80_005664 [Batrachochytrium dendrobatidis]|nr:hypothetical protein O5D80_005664 [Batrachochytrium dendrobatidis]